MTADTRLIEALEAATDGLSAALEVIAAYEAARPAGLDGDFDQMMLDGAVLLHRCREVLASV